MASSTRPPSRLLDLPAELRDMVYHCCMEEMLLELKHPHDDLPPIDARSTMRHLRLVNRQISSEVKNVFNKSILPGVVLHCDSTAELHRLHEKVMKQQELRDTVQFCLIDHVKSLAHLAFKKDFNRGRGEMQEIEKLALQQPAWQQLKRERPSPVRPNVRMYTSIRHRGMDEWWPGATRHIEALSRGYTILGPVRDHVGREYNEAQWPHSGNSLEVKTFVHVDGHQHCIIFKGKLCELEVGKLTERLAREALVKQEEERRWAEIRISFPWAGRGIR